MQRPEKSLICSSVVKWAEKKELNIRASLYGIFIALHTLALLASWKKPWCLAMTRVFLTVLEMVANFAMSEFEFRDDLLNMAAGCMIAYSCIMFLVSAAIMFAAVNAEENEVKPQMVSVDGTKPQ